MQRQVTDQAYTTTLGGLALFEHYGGNYDAAEAIYREVLAADREELGERHTDIGLDMQNLAFVLHDKGDDRGAELLLREAVEIQTEQLGETHKTVAVPMGYLGMTLVMQGNDEEAARWYRESITIDPGLLTQGGPQRAETRGVYGLLMKRSGRYDEAEEHLLGSVEVLRRRLGPDDIRTLTAVGRLVELYEAWNKPEKAAEYRALLEEAKPQ